MMMPKPRGEDSTIRIAPSAREGECAALCAGPWTVHQVALLATHIAEARWPDAGAVAIDGSGISALDTSGAWLLQRTLTSLRARGLDATLAGLRPEYGRLLALVALRGIAGEAAAQPQPPGLLEGLGRQAWADVVNARAFLAFVGESFVALGRSVVHPRRIRWRAILHNMQTAGYEALPITGLLSFLMGIVIAYQGADQLQRFGANIFVADLVGIAMLRELSPLLTAIIVAGRSGSSYAAQIGTMKVTEEVDALRTVGVGPQELLVLPKMLALIIVLPLLTVFTDITGVLGGMLMAQTRLDVSADAFVERLSSAIVLSTYLTGVSKAPVFAAIIALVGCFRGFEATGSADSVGRQTTIAVVQSIFLVIVVDAMFSIVFNQLDL